MTWLAKLARYTTEVNEYGTKTASITYILGCGQFITEPTTNFIVNHPFIFMIRDNTSRRRS